MNRYYCILRPPEPCWLPKGREPVKAERFAVRRYVAQIDRMAWGCVEYAEPLTPVEIGEYGLIAEPREDWP